MREGFKCEYCCFRVGLLSLLSDDTELSRSQIITASMLELCTICNRVLGLDQLTTTSLKVEYTPGGTQNQLIDINGLKCYRQWLPC